MAFTIPIGRSDNRSTSAIIILFRLNVFIYAAKIMIVSKICNIVAYFNCVKFCYL